jgi:hypothetical protein
MATRTRRSLKKRPTPDNAQGASVFVNDYTGLCFAYTPKSSGYKWFVYENMEALEKDEWSSVAFYDKNECKAFIDVVLATIDRVATTDAEFVYARLRAEESEV